MSDEGLGLSCESCPAEATCIIAADGVSSLACEDCWRAFGAVDPLEADLEPPE